MSLLFFTFPGNSLAWTFARRPLQSYIRHGDRSISAENVCWPNDNVVYQCNLTMIQANNMEKSFSFSPQLVFRRTYEVNEEFIPGSCGYGQLTPRGCGCVNSRGFGFGGPRDAAPLCPCRYEQEVKNGEAIRSVYLEGAGLLPLTLSDASDKLMYLRSDDVQRTIMSGQALVSGMYPDGDDNITSPNSRVLTWLVRDPCTCVLRVVLNAAMDHALRLLISLQTTRTSTQTT